MLLYQPNVLVVLVQNTERRMKLKRVGVRGERAENEGEARAVSVEGKKGQKKTRNGIIPVTVYKSVINIDIS